MGCSKLKARLLRWRARLAIALAVSLLVVGSGCFESAPVEFYYGQVRVPRAQELRWSDGGLPQTFDPALADAPPDTDAVRALFEGLTDYDPQTLAPVAGVAARWESSADKRTWTFHLRRDARWSNGEPVRAQDFVRSWQRTLRLGDRAPHANLLANIVGASHTPTPAHALSVAAVTPTPAASPQATAQATPNGTPAAHTDARPAPTTEAATHNTTTPPAFGVEALDDYTLRVELQRPDQNFPALVAHPVFRPVQLKDEAAPASGAVTNEAQQANALTELKPPIVSNGAFQLATTSNSNVVLERAQSYWNAAAVALERVRFVNLRDTEAALAAYHAGEVDAVTNANIEPLAVKLLAPYRDFRRETYGALTYYQFNTAHAPFDDLRVRQALTLAVDRARLSADTLDGATEPADHFFPTTETDEQTTKRADGGDAFKIAYDVPRAQKLLAAAGYPGGIEFPVVRLLVNRNEQHRAVAQAIAAMWHSNLGIETEIVLKNWDEYEQQMRVGDYDIVRRSIVMQTTDEATNLLAMFVLPEASTPESGAAAAPPSPEHANGKTDATAHKETTAKESSPQITTELQALRELPAMPLYFASSYALVKPYVGGFDANLLDAPALQRIRLDVDWQPSNVPAQ